MKLTIECPYCEGSGKHPLPEHLREILALLSVTQPKTASQLWDKHTGLQGVTVNAISNRLQDLLLLDLVDRKRNGKFWLYTRTPKNA